MHLNQPHYLISATGATISNYASIERDLIGSASYDALNGDILQKEKRVKRVIINKTPVKRSANYSLNKSKLRKKLNSYSYLYQSKRFLAFYSISFPSNLSDGKCYQILNTCLTRIRKWRKKFSYIWVAERQKNGTIHFHMITNCYLQIRIVNAFFATAIENALLDGWDTEVRYEKERYNGVDVKRVWNVKGLRSYMSKYITKNNTKSNYLLWNCSSDVSALFTSMKVDSESIYKYFRYAEVDNIEDFHNKAIYLSSFADYIQFKVTPPSRFMESMHSVNQHIADFIYQN